MLNLVAKTDDGRWAALCLGGHRMADFEKFVCEARCEQDDERWGGEAYVGERLDVDELTASAFERSIARDVGGYGYGYLPEGVANANSKADVFVVWDGRNPSLELRGGAKVSVPLSSLEHIEDMRKHPASADDIEREIAAYEKRLRDELVREAELAALAEQHRALAEDMKRTRTLLPMAGAGAGECSSERLTA